MRTIEIHHASHEGTGDFVHVANVCDHTEGAGINDSLEYAWLRTNNIHGSWSRGEFIDGAPNGDYSSDVERIVALPVVEGKLFGLRSSMMGDVFVIDGKRYVVASFGFKNEPLNEKE